MIGVPAKQKRNIGRKTVGLTRKDLGNLRKTLLHDTFYLLPKNERICDTTLYILVEDFG